MPRLYWMTLFLPLLVSCISGPKRLNSATDLLSDTGGLTRIEMEKAADVFALKISEHFKKNPRPEGVFLALRPTKNETSEQIPTELFDKALERHLLRRKIYTVRTRDRKQALEELKFNQQVADSLNMDLKSPNYFVRTRIDESMFRSSGDTIVEQILNIELVSVETTLVAWSEKVSYRKQAASNNGVGW
ncbi:MAG: penicillin-binding protein activator LpoB [Spirochaetota bacterium]